jgi:hypothetical protein
MPGPAGTADPLPLHRARNRGAMYDSETEHEGLQLVSNDAHTIIMFPLHPSVHLAHDVFGIMTFMSTSPLVSHPTKPTSFYPPMHACVASLRAVPAPCEH